MRVGFLFLLFILLSSAIFCQSNEINKISGLPTDEVFDVFAGIKGNIWVAHSLGLSRYDGHVFTHFKAPDEAPMAVTDICQDLQGRIWCHDFNGRIFYVEKEEMKLYEGYKNEDEESFPVMVIVDSELIVTSAKGLFILNTRSFQGYYLNITAKPVFSKSLAVYRNTAIANDRQGAYKYIHGRPLKRIPIVGENGLKYTIESRGFRLAPIHTNDTLYGFNNYEVFSFVERRDTLKIIRIEKSIGMVNTITEENGVIWVNTKKCSYTLNKSNFIYNRNLSDIIKDKLGNIWFGSLQEGLAMKSSNQVWKRTSLSFLEKNDFIRCVITNSDNFLYGTQSGRILIVKNNKLYKSFSLPSQAGSVEHIIITPNKNVLIASSVGLYLIDFISNKLYELSDISTYKDIVITDNFILFASSNDVLKMSIDKDAYELFISKKRSTPFVNSISNFKKTQIFLIKTLNKLVRVRCYRINYNPHDNTTIGIFKDGLGEIKDSSLRYIFYKKSPIQASCLIEKGDTNFIGTFNKGLLIYTGKTITNLSAKEGLSSNTILKMKIFENNLYIVEPGYFQVFDIVTKKFTITVPLPNESNSTIYDFTVSKGITYLTFSNSNYELKLSDLHYSLPLANLLSATAVVSKTSLLAKNDLAFNDNEVVFNLSSPCFYYPEATYFRYRLKGSYDTSWKKINHPIYLVSFPSLKPGNYVFEAYAVNYLSIRSNNTITISFKISKPWWQAWWLILLAFVAIGLVVYSIFRAYYNRIQHYNQIEIDKLLLHDSLRKALLRTITAQMNPHFIFNAMNTIQSFVYRNEKRNASNYLGKFSELIRKILETSNIDSISLSEEVEILKIYLDLEKARFDENLNIVISINDDLNLSEIEVPPMFIQPYVENAIKHGLFHKKGIRELFISINRDNEKNNYIRIIVDDNGIGRHRSRQLNSNLKNKPKSFANNANESRIELMNQTLENKIFLSIIDKPKDSGTKVIIELPVIKWNL